MCAQCSSVCVCTQCVCGVWGGEHVPVQWCRVEREGGATLYQCSSLCAGREGDRGIIDC